QAQGHADQGQAARDPQVVPQARRQPARRRQEGQGGPQGRQGAQEAVAVRLARRVRRGARRYARLRDASHHRTSTLANTRGTTTSSSSKTPEPPSGENPVIRSMKSMTHSSADQGGPSPRDCHSVFVPLSSNRPARSGAGSA